MVLNLCQPSIPVERFWHLLSCAEARNFAVPLVPTALAVHVCYNFADVLNDARFGPSLKLEIIPFRMPLVAHLGDHFKLLLCGHQQFNLLVSMRHRFLNIDMFAQRHGVHTDDEVRMIRRTDADGINLVGHLVKHLAEVLEARRIRKLLHDLFRVLCAHVRVAQGDNITQACFVQ